MGANQSTIKLYLGNKEKIDEKKGEYSIKINKFYYTKCSNFEKIEFHIKYEYKARFPKIPGFDYKKPYDPYKYPDGYTEKDRISYPHRYYDLELYTGTSSTDPGDLIVTYSPKSYDRIVRWVFVYFSVLRPKDILIISLLNRRRKSFSFTLKTLQTVQWLYSYEFKHYMLLEPVDKKLTEEYTSQFGIKLTFEASSKANKDINRQHLNVGDGKEFIKDVFTPQVADAPINTTDLFFRTPHGLPRNQLDPYYLKDVKGQKYDGIIVYFNKKDIAVVIEFIKECSTKFHLGRKDKFGTHWAKEDDIKYTKDQELIEKLRSINKNQEENDIVTYLLDLKQKYNDVGVTKDNEEKKYYTYYTHTNIQGYTSPKSTVLLKSKAFKSDSKEFTDLFLDIVVYFLKPKDGDDTFPFLIKFTKQKGATEWSYFQNTESETDWKSFKHTSELTERLAELEKDGYFNQEKTKLRTLAFNIFKRDAKPGPTIPGPRPAVPVPPVAPPTTETPPPPDIKLIAGSTAGAVGGTAVLGAGGYGYYLYATTIKLLT